MSDDHAIARVVQVPEGCAGMRLDRFLARRFPTRSRSWLVTGIRAGQVTDPDGQALRPSARVQADQELHLLLPGIAPSEPPPPFPTVLYEDARMAVIDKPAGMLAHPAGTDFAWAVISLAKERWPDERMDLVHRLDRDTSGCLLLSKDLEANRHLKLAVKQRRVTKEYEALCKGTIDWDHRHLRGPIGSDGGEIRIKMAVRDDGLQAHTEVTVLDRANGLTHVRCRLHTGRTHQIRVHLAHAGFPLLGDRMYGVPPEVFLHTLDHGTDAWVREQTGAPYHALHARSVGFPHPDGHDLRVEAPLPEALRRWWHDPSVLPHDPESP